MKTATTYTFFTLIWVTLLCSSLSSARAQTVEWIRQLGTTGWDESRSVATDSLGNVYISGFTQGDIDGPGPETNAGGQDAFLAKYDSAGNLTWTKQLGTNQYDTSYGVATDPLGNVYISGTTRGDLDGPGPDTYAGRGDAFLAKYDSSGDLAWTKQLGSTDWDESRSVTTDALGNVYISGTTDGDIGGPYAGGDDAFLAKYDSAGNLAWTRQLGSTDRDKSNGVTTDSLGNVYISGYTNGDIDGAGPGTNAGYNDAFLAKYDSAGNLAWTRQLGTSQDDVSFGVTTDALGNVYISGYAQEGVDGPGPNAFLIKHDSAGNLAWAKLLGTTRSGESFGVTTDALGNVYISGTTYRDLDGPGPDTNAGRKDAFVAKYDSAGNLAWTKQLGTTDWDKSFGVTTDNLGNIYLSGFTEGDLDGPGPGTHAGGKDAFLIKIHDDSFVAVPEPNTLVLMLLAVASLYVCNRHTSSRAALQRKA